MDATFCKAERLTGKKTIEELFQKGRATKLYPFVLLWTIAEQPLNVPVRLAISVPKRRVRHAVDRNRVKRLIRENYRKQKNTLFEFLNPQDKQLVMLLIFVGKAEETDYELVNKKISGLLTRLMNDFSSKTEQ